MPGNVYTITHNWDTVLLLKKPVLSFAEWEKTKAPPPSADQEQGQATSTVDSGGPDDCSVVDKQEVPAIEEEADVDCDESTCDSADALLNPTPS